jgi:hypothetical protein
MKAEKHVEELVVDGRVILDWNFGKKGRNL